mmetsp:Transcript_32086/g.83187  ORF Transcript_32086/g.83187 Transcript_32086/m.83187 type:complete len:264 (+) Transcript_32086:486-1277(+)
MHEITSDCVQVGVQVGVDTSNNVFHCGYHSLNARLAESVVILNVREDLGQAPVSVCFHPVQHLIRGLIHVDFVVRSCSQLRSQKHHDQRCHQIIYSLHVGRCRISDGPNQQRPLHQCLDFRVGKNGGNRHSAWDVDPDLVQQLRLITSGNQAVIELSAQVCVFSALPGQPLLLEVQIHREVAQRKPPSFCTNAQVTEGRTRPQQGSQVREVIGTAVHELGKLPDLCGILLGSRGLSGPRFRRWVWPLLWRAAATEIGCHRGHL